jgi:hypothetical protein
MFFRLSVELYVACIIKLIFIFLRKKANSSEEKGKDWQIYVCWMLQVRHDCEELAGSSSPEDSHDNTLLQSLEIDEKDTRAKVLLQLYIIHFPLVPVHLCILIFKISSQLNMTF